MGGEVWYTWLQLLTMATMGKNATHRNSTSNVGPLLKYSQESSYTLWVTMMWLDLLCASLASCNIIFLFLFIVRISFHQEYFIYLSTRSVNHMHGSREILFYPKKLTVWYCMLTYRVLGQHDSCARACGFCPPMHQATNMYSITKLQLPRHYTTGA